MSILQRVLRALGILHLSLVGFKGIIFEEDHNIHEVFQRLLRAIVVYGGLRGRMGLSVFGA